MDEFKVPLNDIILNNINDSVNPKGETLLHIAAQMNYPALVSFLIKSGADVNALNSKYQTPLHLACKNNNVEIVDILIKRILRQKMAMI